MDGEGEISKISEEIKYDITEKEKSSLKKEVFPFSRNKLSLQRK